MFVQDGTSIWGGGEGRAAAATPVEHGVRQALPCRDVGAGEPQQRGLRRAPVQQTEQRPPRSRRDRLDVALQRVQPWNAHDGLVTWIGVTWYTGQVVHASRGTRFMWYMGHVVTRGTWAEEGLLRGHSVTHTPAAFVSHTTLALGPEPKGLVWHGGSAGERAHTCVAGRRLRRYAGRIGGQGGAPGDGELRLADSAPEVQQLQGQVQGCLCTLLCHRAALCRAHSASAA